MNNSLQVLSAFVLIVFSFLFSCSLEKKPTKNPHVSIPSGQEIFSNRCTSCHGIDGKLGFGGAKDLTLSKKTLPEIIHQVTHGKGAMAPFQNILTSDEIHSVSEYALSLQKNTN